MSVVILDLGSRYTQLVARRIRELHAYSVILPATASADEIHNYQPEAIVLSGGPASVFDPQSPCLDPHIFSCGLPILGIDYGMQYLVHHFGGRVERADRREYGPAHLTRYGGSLFSGLSGDIQVWVSHADIVSEPPRGWRVVAETTENPVAAVESADGRCLGVQFHPEVAHTPAGAIILGNFLASANVSRDWTSEHSLDLLVRGVRERVGDARVLLATSGGVDSSTLALLLARAGVDHTAIFVDHGLLRLGEPEEVERTLRDLGVNLVTVEAADRFLHALKGISSPEEKRRAIGREFIAVFEEKAKELGPFRFLAQGTVYPDVIESTGCEGAGAIKSHHNVGGLPETFGFQLLEPFRHLFKDEVREIARLLELPDAIRRRHPFPGPGLAIRILGEVTFKRLDILRRAEALFIRALKEWGLYNEIWQALAVLTPVRSVGVIEDERHYGYVLALRAVTSVDGMRADWFPLPSELLDEVARQIIRRVPKIGRVVYDITSKPPGTIEWE